MASGSARSRVWVDPRFVLGILIVVLSVAAVVWLVARAERTTTVYRAHAAILSGQAISSDVLDPVQVRLGEAEGRYLRVDDLRSGLVAARPVGAGELVALSNLAPGGGESATTVVLPVMGELPADIRRGVTVDVWSVREGDDGPQAPTVLVGGAEVVEVRDSDGLVSSSAETPVEVRVPDGRVPTVMEALAFGDQLRVVPVGAAPSGGTGPADAAEQGSASGSGR